jgi:hypothetical protein
VQREREREEEGGQKGYLIADLVQGREKENNISCRPSPLWLFAWWGVGDMECGGQWRWSTGLWRPQKKRTQLYDVDHRWSAMPTVVIQFSPWVSSPVPWLRCVQGAFLFHGVESTPNIHLEEQAYTYLLKISEWVCQGVDPCK